VDYYTSYLILLFITFSNLSIFLHKPPHLSCAVAAMDGLVFKLKADSKMKKEKQEEIKVEKNMHIVVKPKQITSSQKADHILKKKNN